MIVMTYLKKFWMMLKADDGDDIFKKVFDDAKDILEKVSDYADDI